MQKGEDYILKTYNRYPVVFEKGDGVSRFEKLSVKHEA